VHDSYERRRFKSPAKHNIPPASVRMEEGSGTGSHRTACWFPYSSSL